MNPDVIYQSILNLRLNYPTSDPLNVEFFILDSEAVPVYDRFRAIAGDDVEDLTTDSVEQKFATTYFQNGGTKLTLGRVVKTATPPAFICETHDETIASWAALTTAGTFTVTDSDVNSTAVTVGDLSGVTTFAQVIVILNAGLAALTTPDVVGLDTATFAKDVSGQMVLTMPSGQDDTDPTISITFSATPASVPYLLGLKLSGDGTSVTGYAIETLLEAYNAAKVLTGIYNVAIEDRGGNDTEAIALAAQVVIDRKQTSYIDTSADAYNPALATDLHSELATLANEGAAVIFTKHSDEYPEAAADASFLESIPGSKSWGHTPLSGLAKASGSQGTLYDLTTTERTVLDDKKNNYVVKMKGYTFVDRGRTAAGYEKRVVRGKHNLENQIQDGLIALDMNEDLLAFDTDTLSGIDGVLRGPLEESVTNRFITSFEITLPDAIDFTDAEKASGNMILENAYRCVGNLGAFRFRIVGSINLS